MFSKWTGLKFCGIFEGFSTFCSQYFFFLIFSSFLLKSVQISLGITYWFTHSNWNRTIKTPDFVNIFSKFCQKWKFRRNEAFSVHFNFEKELKTKVFEEEKIEIEKFSFGFRKKKTEMIVRNLKMWKKWVNGLGFFCLKLKKTLEKMLKKCWKNQVSYRSRFQFEWNLKI